MDRSRDPSGVSRSCFWCLWVVLPGALPVPSRPNRYCSRASSSPRWWLAVGGTRQVRLPTGVHSDFLIVRVATYDHSRVWSAQEAFLLFPSVKDGRRRQKTRRWRRFWRWGSEQQGGTEDAGRHPDCQEGKLIDAVKDQELRHAGQQRGDRDGNNSSGHELARTWRVGAEGHQDPGQGEAP